MEVPAVGWQLLVASGIVVSLVAVAVLSRPGGRWGLLARRRLVAGVPWGTFVAVVGIVGFYLFVQRGLVHPRDPVVVPFRAWGYFYPTGIATAAFAHSGLNHLVGNVVGTLLFGSVAEYAWSHFPRERGSASFSSLSTNPFARIAAWTVAVFVTGLLTGLFALGPVVGFSGVVFAFVGFALVRYPLAAVVGLVATGVVDLVYRALRYPEIARTARETFVTPWWSDVAIQGHALGLFVGIVAGIAVLYRRGVRPNPTHVWLAALLVAVDRGLWAVYTIEGSDRFRLFRALGTALVFLLSAAVAVGATASDRTLLSSIDLSRREAAYGLLLAVLVAVAVVAVPFNLFVVDDPAAGFETADAVEVRDYTVFYAEGVQNQYIPAVPIPGNDASTEGIEASGVIVVSERRNIWWEVFSKGRLASRNRGTVRLGGLTWTENVHVTRNGWNVAGGPPVYHVRLARDRGEGRVVYRSGNTTAGPRVDGRNVTIEPSGDAFAAVVTRNNETLGRATLPSAGNETAAGGLRLRREQRNLYVERGETRVRIARRSS
ncbi:rhomboid family intramembrane serine protease [Natronomonas marina]|uniref:rhomboid family intramembrane serine protease n=1 Tax=Natronomonas marina TaxID=2961939 RepID=UPI0020C93E08|nr:rhomboid family intramembrane serine protease [Natronomonas marina]